jgi:osmoprotectant transport system ATP-binding protein
VTAVVGASGCGKSTLLKLCNGLHRPSSGTVRVFGAALDYDRLPELRRRMGYAVQGTGLFPHLDARANIELGARLTAWPADRRDERVEELAALMHLDEVLFERFPHQLSGGQQQRVGLCRAMMLRPEILLLDEPFAAIDPITRFDIHEQLQRLLAVEPVTVVLVTHDMREAMKLAQTIVVMSDGRVACEASADELRSRDLAAEPERLLQDLLRESA